MPRTAWLVLPLVCACQFVAILDASIVNVALPSIRRDLGFTPAGLAWVVDAYLLTLAGFMLLGGRAADLAGNRRTLTAGVLLFAAASLAAGLAPTAGVLVGARAAQGLGAALLAPATLAVINTTFTGAAARARAFGAWSAAGGTGGMAGALAGGAITTGLSWRWVFLINVPIGALLAVAALAALPSGRAGRRERLAALPGGGESVGVASGGRPALREALDVASGGREPLAALPGGGESVGVPPGGRAGLREPLDVASGGRSGVREALDVASGGREPLAALPGGGESVGVPPGGRSGLREPLDVASVGGGPGGELPGGLGGRREPLDVLGAVTGTAGLGAVIYGVMRGGHGWTIAAGALLLAVFVVVEARVAAAPILPLRLLARRGPAAANGMLLLFGAAAIGLWYSSSLLLQNVLGYTALEAGLGQTPAAVWFVVVARLPAVLLPRFGSRVVALCGSVCLAAGFGWLSRGGADYLGAVLGPTLLVATGIGLVFPTLMAAATAGVPAADAGTAGGLAGTASQAGSSVGLAVLASLDGFDRVFLAAAGVGAALAVLSVLLPRRAA